MYTNTEMYQHAKLELDKLLELERKDNLKRSVEELENEVAMFDGKTPQEFMNDAILTVIASINPEINSYNSMDYLLNTVYDLVKFRNLTPLTLGDEEWVHILDDPDKGSIYQNIRNFAVFKDDKNGVYHSDGPEMLNIACGKYPESGEVMEVYQDNEGESNE